MTLIPLGVVGVLAILPSVAQSLRTVLAELPGAPPVGVLVAVQTVQLLLLMVGGVLLGAWAAPRVGFTSRLLERDRTALRRDVLVALLPGILAGVWIVVGDLVTAPFLGADWAEAVSCIIFLLGWTFPCPTRAANCSVGFAARGVVQ